MYSLFHRKNSLVAGVACHVADAILADDLADDIKQGSVGDCWLMACLASLSKHPAMISSLMLTKTYNAYGRYTVRLFDPTKNKWVRVVVRSHAYYLQHWIFISSMYYSSIHVLKLIYLQVNNFALSQLYDACSQCTGCIGMATGKLLCIKGCIVFHNNYSCLLDYKRAFSFVCHRAC